jgi:tetratricopeptide (TPR) repeat protein
LQSEGNLAMTLSEQGSFEEAEEIEVRVLAARERVLGLEHPHTLAARGNWAKTLFARGDFRRAAAALRAVLAAETRVLGPEHPATLVTHTNLAVAIASAGDEQEAARMCAELLPVCERVLGRDSLDTLTCAAALATTGANGANGVREMRRVFETHVRVLGDEHPITVQSAHALAKLLVRSGARDEARALLARASRAAKSALGADHRGTRAIEADLACLMETAERGASKCANCGASTTRVCGRCRAARYCSRECQRACWRAHAPSCVP